MTTLPAQDIIAAVREDNYEFIELTRNEACDFITGDAEIEVVERIDTALDEAQSKLSTHDVAFYYLIIKISP